MSPSEPRPSDGSSTPSARDDPLAARIPSQSQLARFQQEAQRDGNTLVGLSHGSRDVKSVIRYHKSRASQAIKLFHEKFGKQTAQVPSDAVQEGSHESNSTSGSDTFGPSS